jgi:hypothetical protein
MNDFFTKLIGLFMAFFLLVIAPITNNALAQDLTTKRAILNEMTNFVDKVTDSGHISPEMLTDFYLGCSSHGAVVDVTVQRYIKIVNPNGSGGTYITYVLNDQLTNWNQSDIIKVKVEAISYTGAQRLMWYFLRLITPKLEFEIAGMVR